MNRNVVRITIIDISISSQTNHSIASLAPKGLHQMEQRQASVLKMRNPKTLSRITTATGRAANLGGRTLIITPCKFLV